MTRKEALDILMSANVWNDEERTAWEVLVPELAESEDERILRVISEAVITFFSDYANDFEDEDRDAALAWLEKQKENPKSSDSIPSDCTSDAKCGNSRHKVGDTLEGRKLADEVVAYLIKSGYQPIIKDTLDQKHFQIKIPRHKEDFFLSTEYKYCREILDEYYYEGDFAGDVYTLYVLKQKEQKPAECIEDSVKFEEGFKAGRESGLRDGQKYVLNNLDSYGLCKPAEWSEEDEEMLDSIIRVVCGVGIQPNGLREKQVSFLKSLRPSWKPSEEQMKYLLMLADYFESEGGTSNAKTLREFHEQLDKLCKKNEKI